jgi:hypothetical protein
MVKVEWKYGEILISNPKREIKMAEKINIKNLLCYIEKRKINKELYWLMIPKEISSLSLNTECMLTNGEEIENNNLLRKEYNSSINIDDIEDILNNLRQQVKSPTIEQKLQALNYYIENDAFGDFLKHENKKLRVNYEAQDD